MKRRLIASGAILIALYGVYRWTRLPPSPSAEPFRRLIIAHRGGSDGAPENTLAAIRRSHSAGASAVSVDVRLSRDLVPIVIHDETVERTTNGRGRVDALSVAELKRLDASNGIPAFAGERIPTLEELIQLCLQLGMKIEIAIKGGVSDSDRIAREVRWLFAKYDLYGRAFVSSFYPGVLYRLRREDPRIVTAHAMTSNATGNPLIDRLLVSPPVTRFLGAGIIAPHRGLVSVNRMKEWQAAGYVVNVWTANSANDKAWLESLGVSYTTRCPQSTCQDYEPDNPPNGVKPGANAPSTSR
ncbi:MAG: glycerophosphodiester phosphodiesterase [Bryobacteraceae bacterium]